MLEEEEQEDIARDGFGGILLGFGVLILVFGLIMVSGFVFFNGLDNEVVYFSSGHYASYYIDYIFVFALLLCVIGLMLTVWGLTSSHSQRGRREN